MTASVQFRKNDENLWLRASRGFVPREIEWLETYCGKVTDNEILQQAEIIQNHAYVQHWKR
jgi:hypothetical protein